MIICIGKCPQTSIEIINIHLNFPKNMCLTSVTEYNQNVYIPKHLYTQLLREIQVNGDEFYCF